jgi:hypothetical protein
MNVTMRNVVFVFSGALAGFLSGLLLPQVFGVRGAILGAALSVGALDLNPRRTRRNGRPATVVETLKSAILTAIPAWLAILAWNALVPVPDLEPAYAMEHSLVLSSGTSCLTYTITLLMGYRARLARKWTAWVWFALAPFLGAAARSAHFTEPSAYAITWMMGALPFVALWLIAARLTDPAWSERGRPTDKRRHVSE